MPIAIERVTVADDGGSSGRLREQFDVLPPGDLRMALSALCDDSAWGHLWREAMQHRFSTLPGSSGELDGHAMGNLLLLSLWLCLRGVKTREIPVAVTVPHTPHREGTLTAGTTVILVGD